MSEARPTVAVIGASENRSKYGNKAVRAFRDQGWEVYPIHPHAQEIEGLKAYPSLQEVPVARLDRASFYVHPDVGIEVLEAFPPGKVGEVWLNPGSESDELVARAEALGYPVVQACSILGIGTSPSRY
jgi:predicted CoA-binding protein